MVPGPVRCPECGSSSVIDLGPSAAHLQELARRAEPGQRLVPLWHEYGCRCGNLFQHDLPREDRYDPFPPGVN